MILAIDADMDRGNENRPLTVNFRDKILDLRIRYARLLQYVGKVRVGHVAKDREKAPKIVVDPQNLQVHVST